MCAFSSDSMTAATSAGRVPLADPGPQYTFKPTMSCDEINESHAEETVGLPASVVSPRSIIGRTRSIRGSNASVACSSCTITTRVALLRCSGSKSDWLACARQPNGSAPNASKTSNVLALDRRFLDTLNTEWYHHN